MTFVYFSYTLVFYSQPTSPFELGRIKMFGQHQQTARKKKKKKLINRFDDTDVRSNKQRSKNKSLHWIYLYYLINKYYMKKKHTIYQCFLSKRYIACNLKYPTLKITLGFERKNICLFTKLYVPVHCIP